MTEKRYGKELHELNDKMCRYPITEGSCREHLFCGEKATRGCYCERHYDICYIKPKQLTSF